MTAMVSADLAFTTMQGWVFPAPFASITIKHASWQSSKVQASRAEFEGIGRNEENPDRPETAGALSRHARPIHLVPAMR